LEIDVFYNNGQIYVKCFYKDGKENGEYIRFYYNGQVWEKCFFKDGKIDGIRTFYNTDNSIYYEKK
jgi:antitoxin component YwqK of YwqJK toxin-antitoxin module